MFDKNLPVEQKSILVKKIGEQTSGGIKICKPTLPTLNSKYLITDFVGPRSTVLFDLLEIPLDFLKHKDWHQQQEFKTVKNSLKNCSPLNDSCERALGLATRINTHITRDEDSFQDLIQVEAHRIKYGNNSKKDLQKCY